MVSCVFITFDYEPCLLLSVPGCLCFHNYFGLAFSWHEDTPQSLGLAMMTDEHCLMLLALFVILSLLYTSVLFSYMFHFMSQKRAHIPSCI